MRHNQIIELLHSIKEVKLDSDGKLLVKFTDPDPVWADGWEPISGYVSGSFTEQLLLLIEEALQGKLSSSHRPTDV